jgi:hypothetical protein
MKNVAKFLELLGNKSKILAQREKLYGRKTENYS